MQFAVGGGRTTEPEATRQQAAFGFLRGLVDVGLNSINDIAEARAPIDRHLDELPPDDVRMDALDIVHRAVPNGDQLGRLWPGLTDVATLKVTAKHDMRIFVQHTALVDMGKSPVVVALIYELLQRARRVILVRTVHPAKRRVQDSDVEVPLHGRRIGSGQVFRHCLHSKALPVQGDALVVELERLRLSIAEHLHVVGQRELFGDLALSVMIAVKNEHWNIHCAQTTHLPHEKRPVWKSRQSPS